MRSRVVATAVVGVACGALVAGQSSKRLNPLVDLLAQKKPVFGLYAPANRGGGPGRQGGNPAAATPPAASPNTPPPAAPTPKSPADLAKEALAYQKSDFLFSGSMEGGVDRGLPAFTDFVTALKDAAGPDVRWKYPLSVKTPKISRDPAKAIENISRQLNTGVSAVVLVDVESAAEAEQGIAAMRFKSKGGTRPDDVGTAPAYWGLGEAQYREKADVWPLNPQGELVNWTIVESKEGLAHVREIAAVKGIGVLFPGAGTLRGVFTTTDAEGKRTLDSEAWEKAIQQVLSACKEFNVACGYPATANDIEMRMKQGFSVFIINWGEQGFQAVDIGRQAAGRGTK